MKVYLSEVGRITIPKVIRKQLEIGPGDALNLKVNNKQIILEPHNYIDYEKKYNQLVSSLKAKGFHIPDE